MRPEVKAWIRRCPLWETTKDLQNTVGAIVAVLFWVLVMVIIVAVRRCR